MSKPGRTHKDQAARRRKLGKRNPERAIAEHRKREKRRKRRGGTQR